MKTGRDFLKKTRYKYLSPSHQTMGIEQPPLEKEYDRKKKGDILLPPPDSRYEVDLCEAIVNRRSIRNYSRDPLSLEELSFLLYMTQGVKEVYPSATLRTVPSAGARHALETYLLVNRVNGLSRGLYRFMAILHQLLVIDRDDTISSRMTKAALGQKMVEESAVTFIWSGVFERMSWRYGERGYRYLFLDAGHVCQNLYLASEVIKAGVCGIAAFDDDAMNSLLGLDGEEEWVIYLATLGKK